MIKISFRWLLSVNMDTRECGPQQHQLYGPYHQQWRYWRQWRWWKLYERINQRVQQEIYLFLFCELDQVKWIWNRSYNSTFYFTGFLQPSESQKIQKRRLYKTFGQIPCMSYITCIHYMYVIHCVTSDTVGFCHLTQHGDHTMPSLNPGQFLQTRAAWCLNAPFNQNPPFALLVAFGGWLQ